MEVLDITATVGAGSVMWPGEAPPARVFETHTCRGDPSTVSRWSPSAHTGTHVDAGMHFVPGGWTMEGIDLARCVGPCRVVDMTHVGGHVGREDLERAEVAGTARLLLKTRNSELGLLSQGAFSEDFVAVSREGAEYLVEIGVETIGVDYLSVEAFEEGGFPAHHALLGADAIILEALALHGIEPGEYFLACLPLELEGPDGAPARAVLIRDL